MQPWQKGLALLTCFSALTAGSCEKRTVDSIPIPPERMDCVKLSKRPKLQPEYQIDWNKVTTVPQAQAEHDKFVAVIRDREKTVAGYILEVEGELFACSNDAQWLREWQAQLRD
jgi:hypothetical protein